MQYLSLFGSLSSLLSALVSLTAPSLWIEREEQRVDRER